MAADTRTERIVLETSRFRIAGKVTLPAEGVRTRLSDLLNAEGIGFIAVTDAELTPLDGGEPERRDFIAVAREHIQLAFEDQP